MTEADNTWDDELDEEWDEDDDIGSLGFEAILSRFLGYEVAITGTGPFRFDVLQPSTPESAAIIVGVHADCVVVQADGKYVMYPQGQVVVSVPAEEWESDEWEEPSE